MLSILGNVGGRRGPSRRELLKVGAVSLAGLSLPDLLRSRSHGQTRDARPAQAMILLYLQGAPSHI
ncbi:MAG: hypothetical protein U0793_34425, partial [Gemmataceae bacterium]